ncbi:unnamed protein product [Paramecium sonneborni]|uniref:Protein kinase domain-containing protein n=1 Tax=Paramecium sonneborni TaxID=65129 RepID=A0A8S1R2X0_9CILI|nr:unnamed protein product [Paramecium sonneborni]
MKQQLSLLNLTSNQPKTKASIIHKVSDQKKKMSSFDVLGKSPYKSNFNRQNSRHLLKEYQPITSRVNQRQSFKSPPESTKNSKPISISNNNELKQMDSQKRASQKSYQYQLKALLGSEQEKPTFFDQTKRINTQINSNILPQSPKQNIKTSPDVKYSKIENSKSKASFQNTNLSVADKILQLEKNKQKIISMQLKLAKNIKQRPQKQSFPIIPVMEKSEPHNFQQNQKKQLPQTALVVLQNYSDVLSDFEKKEIIDYETIYYLAPKQITQNQKDSLGTQFNNGFDTQDGDYIFIKQDQIAYRYEMLEKLGHGSFGYVFKVMDHKHHQQVALKIIKNKEKFYKQALIEIDILKVVNKADVSCCLIKMLNYFEFRGHICMVFELLSCNLYEFIAINDFVGFDLDLIRRFAIQILQGLLYLKECNIIHCDLKPENILLKDFNRSGIRIIDFGSSCFNNQKIYSYIQSRFYRAPEVVLGLGYSSQIDMWSFGCIIAELFTGESLFQSKSEKELLFLQIKVIGMPPKELIEQGSRKSKFFDEKCQLNYKIQDQELLQEIKTLNQHLQKADPQYQDFVIKCLKWNPDQRMTPEEALIHPWIINGLPATVRKQHIQQMKNFMAIPEDLDFKQGQGEQQNQFQ